MADQLRDIGNVHQFGEKFRLIENMRWEPIENIGSVAIPPFGPFMVVNLTAGAEGAGSSILVKSTFDPVATPSTDESSRGIGFAGPLGVAAKSGGVNGKGVGNLRAPYIGRVSGEWETSGSSDEEDITPQTLYVTSESNYVTRARDGYTYGRFWPIGEFRDAGSNLHDVLLHGNPVANVEVSESATGSCGCEVANGVVEPVTSPPFYWKAAMQWKEPSRVVAWLNTISGFESLTYDDLYLTWNGNGAWNSPVFIRTCGSASDSYMATAQQVAGGWRWTFSAVGTVTCSDQVKLVLKSKKSIPYEDRTNWLVIDTDLTPAKGTAGYVPPPRDCLFCWSPIGGQIETRTYTAGLCTMTVPRYIEMVWPTISLFSGSSLAAFVEIYDRNTEYSPGLPERFKVYLSDFIDVLNSQILPRSIIAEVTQIANTSSKPDFPLVLYRPLEQDANWGPVTIPNCEILDIPTTTYVPYGDHDWHIPFEAVSHSASLYTTAYGHFCCPGTEGGNFGMSIRMSDIFPTNSEPYTAGSAFNNIFGIGPYQPDGCYQGSLPFLLASEVFSNTDPADPNPLAGSHVWDNSDWYSAEVPSSNVYASKGPNSTYINFDGEIRFRGV